MEAIAGQRQWHLSSCSGPPESARMLLLGGGSPQVIPRRQNIAMSRKDICPQVIHFTKGANADEAFARLRAILAEGRLLGASGNIKGGYRCVCFTEAPLGVLPAGFVNSTAFGRYLPFGIMFDKRWLFANGGRPVIYQTDGEFADLPEEFRWRHVRYEPAGAPGIDFTWE